MGHAACTVALLFASCVSGLAMAADARDIVLAENGKARSAIVLAKSAILPEQTAAAELRDYLGKVTGAAFDILAEGEEPPETFLICVGPSRYARDMGIEADRLGPERWFMRSRGNRLALVGGRPRGTLYAVYHFLEDVVGVHWWSVWDEHVPHRPALTIGHLDRHGEPAFSLRGQDTVFYYSRDTRFAARNRVNYSGHCSIPFEYGGETRFGPPRACHTFCNYFPPSVALFRAHPEWFAMDKDGNRKRSDKVQTNQLCLSNQKLRESFLVKLRENIKKSRDGPIPPVYFDLSPNDSSHSCQCEACRRIVKEKGGADAGLLLDFLNDLADRIKDEYPEVILEALAYLNTEKPPKNIKARPNVAITLCDTRSNYLEPVPKGGYFDGLLAAWSRIADRIMIWDYHSTFAAPLSPVPLEHTFQPDLQLFHRHGVAGVKTQYHYAIDDEMRDYRQWLLAKLYADPSQDVDALSQVFLEGFYGPAAPHIRAYLQALRAAARAKPSTVRTQTEMGALRYLDLPFLREAQAV
ncbi:MAG: DUF4838 domain-containing protein, partial [Planctomycetes bacterium]|nr:DUF4838 domain-containing protein [Planctomycetota bacterium]